MAYYNKKYERIYRGNGTFLDLQTRKWKFEEKGGSLTEKAEKSKTFFEDPRLYLHTHYKYCVTYIKCLYVYVCFFLNSYTCDV